MPPTQTLNAAFGDKMQICGSSFQNTFFRNDTALKLWSLVTISKELETLSTVGPTPVAQTVFGRKDPSFCHHRSFDGPG